MILTEEDSLLTDDSHLLLSPLFPAVEPRSRDVLGVPVSSLTMQEAISTVNYWVEEAALTRLVTFTNVHMIVEAHVRPRFGSLLRSMDMNCPDGAPIFWLARREHPDAEKVSGPDFMPLFCEQSVRFGYRHFFYGGGPDVARDAANALLSRYPGLQIAGHLSPPFRDLNAEETDAVIQRMNESGADLVWVCLGCPKQETWINEHRQRLNAKVVLAVGQAFDIVAGRTSRAPAVLRNSGLEWVYRLCKEPSRLWKRYLVTNALFSLLLIRDKVARRIV